MLDVHAMTPLEQAYMETQTQEGKEQRNERKNRKRDKHCSGRTGERFSRCLESGWKVTKGAGGLMLDVALEMLDSIGDADW
jgi:hypothetical protein